MIIEYYEVKNQKNIAERGLSFDLVAEMDMSTASMIEDVRNNYPEKRFIITGIIGTRLHVTCITPIAGGFRVTSLRKANKREVKNYEKQTTV